MDPDVIEIPPPPPPIRHNPRLVKQKLDVIDIDDGDDSADLMIIGEKLAKSNKGKTIEAVHDGYGNLQVVEMSDSNFCQPDGDNFGPVNGIETSNGYPSVSHNLISADGFVSEDYAELDEDYIDLFSEDYAEIDEYALLQAQFDNVDLPPGVEAPFTWLPDYDIGSNQTGNSSLYPWRLPQSVAKNSHLTDSPQSSCSVESTNPKIIGSSAGGSNLQIKMGDVAHSSGMELSSHQLMSQAALSKKKSATSQRRGRDLSTPLGVKSSKSQWFSEPLHSKKKPAIFGASTNHGFVGSSAAMKLPPAGEPLILEKFKSAKKAGGSSSSSWYHSKFIVPFHPPGIESENPWWKNSQNFKPIFPTYTSNSTAHAPFDFLHAPPGHMHDNFSVHHSARDGNNGGRPVVTISDEVRDEILRNFRSFKHFDTVEDASDHYFIGYNSSMKQHPKNWAKKIQEEWKILEKDLPDSIFVRVYESRMDLLRAVIIGAEGTPYHDGLFFFDVFFPSDYPNVPPQVHYHSGGLRLNPNLYNCGKVCLSLLNTWSGSKNERWLPGVSTILQVLVSIQGLILNTKPYFNEPGFARMSGSANGEKKSLQYNEDTFILSLRTMMYMMRRPPKNFENFVAGHFCTRAHDILVACKAYMEGAQVGCLVKGGVQDVDEGDKSCSKQFKDSLTGYVNMLVKEFAQIGAKDCEKFLSPGTTINMPLGIKLGGLPQAAT